MAKQSNWFGRFLLPGFAFKAVVIGGGYATGRELASFFLPSGPRGGVYGMLLATAIWSVTCALTFLFALRTESHDYRAFFRNLLGPAWPTFEVAYGLALMVTLAVFAAAAGEIGLALFGWPTLVGALALMTAISSVAAFGNRAVERLFKYVSLFLYLVYALFLVLSVSKFGHRITDALVSPVPTTGWVNGGLTYAAYNVVGAVVILPMIRHLRSPRDAVIAGLLAGPLAMVPAMLFFVSMAAFYPAIADKPLPSDFLLGQLSLPVFRLVFQMMIFAALLESGVGGVHAINERIATACQSRGGHLSRAGRFGVASAILTVSVFVATRIGLIELVASGYRFLAYVFLAVFIIPLLIRSISFFWSRWTMSPDSAKRKDI